MSLESAVSFFIAVLIFGVTPGPGVFAILSRGMINGSKACVMLALGMTISDMLYLIAACLGLAVLATHMGDIFFVVRIVGGAYLIYLGWKMWTMPINLEETTQSLSTSGYIKSFVEGLLISASNPKVILFYIAFLPTFMDLASLDAMDIAIASVLTVIALMIGLMAIAIFASKAREFFTSEASTKRLNRGAGSIMVAAGAFLASRS